MPRLRLPFRRKRSDEPPPPPPPISVAPLPEQPRPPRRLRRPRLGRASPLPPPPPADPEAPEQLPTGAEAWPASEEGGVAQQQPQPAQPPAAPPDQPLMPDAPTEEVPAVPADPAESTPRRRRLPRPHLSLPHVPLPLALAFALVAVAAVAIALIALGVFGEDSGGGGAPGPQVSGGTSGATATESAASQLGFPAFATKNTTRVGGSDPAADAAGVALATYPSAGSSAPPQAVTLVSQDDWAGGIAAAVLSADPVRAPVLISSPDGIPAVTGDALAALDPKGGPDSAGNAIFAIGDVAAPGQGPTAQASGPDPATEAARIEQLRSKLFGGPPRHIVVTTQEQPSFAMPAAGWAARSGDPVLFAKKNVLPKATAAVLKANKGVPVYVLGPPSVLSDKLLGQISAVSSQVRRVFGGDPVTNAIEFATYVDGSFGWNINDSGHGFVVARSDRPLDAAAAAPLSSSGTWGPLLLSDSAETLPGALRGYFLDVKPGYESDPTRAFYNHVWIIGDQDAIDLTQQGTIDDEADLARIGPPPGQTPGSAAPKQPKKRAGARKKRAGARKKGAKP